ncbi:Dimeric dUTPase, all-alpha-NTP-PPase (MazG) superfamily [Gracilibacillus orientalis]|uniref:Dimeric dUTPase, all-alpha-NTP-PPase (MazG) superfamily n=1 Tax=Gracilibacillus orientalis TaxID=334253 RepID=A0A1I4MVX0_9BACI|nr:dUTP diphosphatase [Gracilibacillus orientalis]SFM07441.1 Dimeric dUTPase, all-alpha-NTP-PPase (MazG) superfamily [Gracilibacillus orientalis]
MNWQTLFDMQRELDNYILAQHDLKNENVFDKKVLALLVEVGELANETRCFKYWSVKPASEKSVIAEEYVDGIHFILSLGLELGLDQYQAGNSMDDEDLTSLFHQVFRSISVLKEEQSVETYNQVFDTYLKLGEKLGFSANDIKKAYVDKNKINFERQNQGY